MMTSVEPVVLILGSGKNIGESVGKYFAAKGYGVAYVSRNVDEDLSKPKEITIRRDLTKPESVADVFERVKSHLGVPTTVVYNAYGLTITGNEGPLSVSLDDFTSSFHANTTSVLAALKQCVKYWEDLPDDAKPTFIFTGNGFWEKPIPAALDLGVGKAATANMIQLLAETYKDKSYKFYFADERMADGDLAWYCHDGDAHAKLYYELSVAREQRAWNHTFVKGKGYVFFENANITDGSWATPK